MHAVKNNAAVFTACAISCQQAGKLRPQQGGRSLPGVARKQGMRCDLQHLDFQLGKQQHGVAHGLPGRKNV